MATTKSPREYDKHERHGRHARKTNSQREAFLDVEATRLSSTAAVIAAKLKKYTPEKIKSASSLSDIP